MKKHGMLLTMFVKYHHQSLRMMTILLLILLSTVHYTSQINHLLHQPMAGWQLCACHVMLCYDDQPTNLRCA
jgi:hypothetical protein